METTARRLSVSGGRIRDIDALRCFAMIGVIAQHSEIFPVGWIGVWLFFVISGFVVTYSVIDTDPKRGPQGWLTSFYRRRTVRIVPIYYLYVALLCAASAFFVGQIEWRPLASLLLFYNNFEASLGDGFFKLPAGGHLWTISTEMQFYLVFGIAFCRLSRGAFVRMLVLMAILCPLGRLVASLVLQRVSHDPLASAYTVYTASFLHFDAFAAGALLALFRDRLCSGRRPFWILGSGLLAAFAYAVFYVVRNVLVHHATGLGAFKNVFSGIMFGDYREVICYSVIVLAAAGLVATTVSGRAPWAVVLKNPFLQYVGKISYGGYVYHAGVVLAAKVVCFYWLPKFPDTMLGKLLSGVIVFAMAVPVTIGLAHLSYRWIEAPLLRRVSGRPVLAPAEASAW